MTKVLLVEDDWDVADVTAYLLRRHGFDVVTAADGVEALSCWRADTPDLVLLDVALPGLSGFDVARAIRSESPGTRVVFLSAHADEAHVVQGRALGAAYVTKPYNSQQLLAGLQAVLDAAPAR